ncbi:MAG: J domain-containing protein [Myxococcales bacterium]|nr:J domain-containing protein [Myxococcales bacterium]
MKDLYQSLGVNRDASKTDIKKAFRKLTQQFHPDKNPGDAKAEERFKEVSTAYEVLGDEDKRKLYDEFGEMSLTQGFDPERARAYKQARSGFGGRGGAGGFPGGNFSSFGDARGTNFDDLLSQLFGGGQVRDADDLLGNVRGRRRRTTHDIEGEITVSFTDALFGTTVPLQVTSSGGGSKRTLDVRVPQGMRDGGKLRLRGQGGGDPAGDILLTVKVRGHRLLRREGDNLHMELPVTALEAYRGGKIDVPTPWGPVTLKLPAGAQSGQQVRLKGRGVKQARKPDGDLMLTLSVKLPAKGDEQLLAALERLQQDQDLRENLVLEQAET